MTQNQHDLEFERFSELLDADPTNPRLGNEGELLLQLREALQNQADLGLPADFASTTAHQVRQRFSSLPLTERLYSRSSAFFSEPAFSVRSLGVLGGLTGLGLGIAYLSPKALLIYASTLLGLGLIWMAKTLRRGEYLPTFGTSSQTWKHFCYYSVPVLAILSTGALAGAVLRSLGNFSYSFREREETLALVALFGGLATALMLSLALRPVWRYCRETFTNKLGYRLFHHGVYGAWLVGTGALFLELGGFSEALKDPRFWASHLLDLSMIGWSVFGFCLLLGLGSGNHGAGTTGGADGRYAVKRTASSLLAGGVLIGGALVVFYQAHLTREFYDPNAYLQAISEAEALLGEELAVSPQDNGWLEVRGSMLRPYNLEGEGKKRNEALKALSPFVDTRFQKDGTPGNFDRKEWAAAKADFLEELPSIERALGKPHFSTVVTEGFGLEKMVPDFIAYRSVVQGLSLLAQEALEEGRNDDCLHYLDLGLRWSNKEKSLSLISLMIRVAMTAIILEPLERAILDGRFSEEELRQLAHSLQANRPQTSAFKTAMLGEFLMFDTVMKRMNEGGFQDKSGLFDGGDELQPARYLTLLPGYLKSEHKAYFNHQLPYLNEWERLTRTDSGIGTEINPLNVASSILIPNHARAQSHFMLMLSRYQAAEMLVALERYRRQHGAYPESLEDLVPQVLGQVPEDPIRPEALGKKPGFRYLKDSEDSYRLSSDSEIYQNINLLPRQVYGPGGNRGLKHRE